jgi:RNA polymerase sigma factor (sigma-70 family)
MNHNEKKSAMSPSDEELFVRFRATRDEDAFSELVRRHQGTAFRVAYFICQSRSLAEEAVQDAFANLAAAEKQFHQSEADAFRRWFYSIVSNAAKMLMRGRRRRLRREQGAQYRERVKLMEAEKQQAEAAATERLAQQETHLALNRLMSELHEDLRMPILLNVVEGFSGAEVGRILGLSPQLVHFRIEKGLRLLREKMRQSGAAPSVAALSETLRTCLTQLSPSPAAQQSFLSASKVAQFGNAVSQSARLSFAWPTKVIAATCLVALTGGGLMYAGFLSSEQTPDNATPSSLETSAATVSLAQIPRSWAFNEGIPEQTDWRLQGQWQWLSQGQIDGTGALKAASEVATLSATPFLILPKNVGGQMVTFDVFSEKLKSAGFGVGFHDLQKNVRIKPLANFYQTIASQQGKHRWTIYVREDAEVFIEADGLPMSRVKPDMTEATEGFQPEKHRILLNFLGFELDNLSIRPMRKDERLNWAKRWEERMRRGDDFWVSVNFDTPFIEDTTLWRFGDMTWLKNKGRDQSGCLLINASQTQPAGFVLPARHGRGLRVVHFDYLPLNEESARPERIFGDVGVYSFPKNSARNSWSRYAADHFIPERLKDLSFLRNVESQPSANRMEVNQWHAVKLEFGEKAMTLWIDDKLQTTRKGEFAITETAMLEIWLTGVARLDNLRLRFEAEK